MVVDEKTIITGDIRTIMIEEPIEESKSSSPAIKMCIIKDEAVLETFMGNKKKISGIFKMPDNDDETSISMPSYL